MAKLLLQYHENDAVDAFALLKKADVRQTKTGKDYLALTFSDRSGDIPGNLWDVTKEGIDQFQAGRVVKVTGTRSAFKGSPQIQISQLRLTEDGEPSSAADFIKSAPVKKADLEAELTDTIFKITQPTWNRLVRQLFKKFHDDFMEFPAAKTNHHAFARGLAFHSLSIARLADKVSDLYPQLNKDLLLAGALLHDLGKVIELSGPASTEYTRAGKLIGHITLIDEQLVLAANELKMDLNQEDVLILRHVVLAHHGLLEYGSPVRPRMMEAEILHQLDEMDASIQMMTGAMEQTEPGEFSKRIFAMDNRAFYRPESVQRTEGLTDDDLPPLPPEDPEAGSPIDPTALF
ncbi:3'-5' exoribonuclease YhaM family protein [Fructobacillus evanidus]|uniref:3'-5' exoribonuclease YhaM family protein n=1 Tax=Fructobacillus evanidus TaxID=3064281 RepID=UPI002DA421B3|nr:3'-5' exoribonuclease YhaM [Fructobacillus sp. LMG 32999]CAK1248942.1 3'-5' exoribonuclease YhaM [Fructobacillus sp. LMG 32999]CAK1249952.1 3'-5' exoribonuclease YhaM [Fructobacillus sp. LMG 32999]